MVNETQIDAMANVLRKLQESTNNAAQDIVTESKHTPELGFAVEVKRTQEGVSVSHYAIVAEKKAAALGFVKNFYHVIDTNTNEQIYKDLGLFESAMGIVKHLLYTNNIQRIERLVEFDASYVGHLIEAFGYKKKMKQLNESSVRYDIIAAKYTNARDKLDSAKMCILKAL